MMDQAKAEAIEGDSTALTDGIVIKQEPPWPMEEEPHDQPSAVDSTVQPMCDDTYGSPLGLGNNNTDKTDTSHGRLSTEMADHVRKESGDSAVDFVLKLEPPWSMEEEPQGQLSAIYSTVQPRSDTTSGSPPSPNSSLHCQHCSVTFPLFTSLKRHMAAVHGHKLHAVLPVSPTFDGDRKGVGRTKDKVNGNDADERDGKKKSRRHICDVCKKTFTRADHLKRHTLIHTNHKPFVCDVCSKAFTRASHLKRHTLTHSSQKPLVCDVCGEVFLTASYLKTHRLIHCNYKPFSCDMCSEGFTSASKLKTHKRLHTGERPYKCPHCDADFIASDDLQRHVKTAHASDRSYVCDVCGAAFSEVSNLKRHKKIHTGEKPHACDICEAAFSRADDLKRHRNVHLCEKPLLCTDCGKGFARSSHLKRHSLIHTGEKPHACQHCPAAFTQSGDLKRHVQRLHL